MEETWRLTLTCTDRDKHPAQVVHDVAFHGPLDRLQPQDLTPSLSTSMIELECPSCPRTPRFRHEDMMKLGRAVVQMMHAGQHHVSLDISKLDR